MVFRAGPDASVVRMSGERWILTATVLFVVLGGLFPNAIVIQHSAEAIEAGEASHTSDVISPIAPHRGSDSYVQFSG
jgi:hypothetical protein